MTHAHLEDILEHPHEDAPRLRYADWLDERCDPLGEFIRVQVRLASVPADHPGALELERRDAELQAEFGDGWAGSVARKTEWWTFRRGFVEEVALTADEFLASGDDLFRLAPIQEVHLGRVRDRLEALAASPLLRRVSHLDLSNNPVRDVGARLLAESPNLDRLRGLNLSSSGLGDSGLKALAASTHLSSLRELYLCDNRIGSAGARALAASPLALQLEAVHLRFNTIGPDGADTLRRRFGARVHM